jgi:glycosyltransferase involved in cell wall biosynthesis
MQEFTITVCYRPVPVRQGARHIVSLLLEEAGHCVTQVQDGPLELKANNILWIMENANWFPTILKQLEAKPKLERPLVVLWHWEPLPPPRTSGQPQPRLYFREIAKILLRDRRATDVYTNSSCLRRLARSGLIDLLVASSQSWCDFLAEHGIKAHWEPIGYEPSDGHDIDSRRDIDAFFLGTLDVPRRKRIIKHLRKNGVNLLAKGSWFDPDYWGQNRTRLINRAKIFLNIQRQPGEIAGHRLILGMANKALVISEPIYNPAPFVPGKHYISAEVEEMPKVIRYYLENDDERECIVNEAYQFVTQEVTMERSVSRILKLISEHRGQKQSS